MCKNQYNLQVFGKVNQPDLVALAKNVYYQMNKFYILDKISQFTSTIELSTHEAS